MKRTTARELAFKTIYSKFFNADGYDDLEFSNEGLEFTAKILKCFAEKYSEINDIISSHLKGYTLQRLFKVDLAIITLAVIELKFLKENPTQVVINEAVELAI